jgi:hypothetical protein
MRGLVAAVVPALFVAACGSDGRGGCPGGCGPGFECDEARGVCVPADGGAEAGADADVPDGPGEESTAPPDDGSESPGEAFADDARGEVVGPCAAAGGVCRPLVSTCARCLEGEEPAPTEIRCPPENHCCVPRTAAPPYPPCVEQGGVCYPASSGSECPPGWRREDVDCGGPAGCCLPADYCA